ncbi:hypothetical protein XENOCAPTIV_014085 [Xenoophorus captivus]|uniref:Uncharacterized protein n=1 Tax=Xenoophorus captivus TaxID=1517983 RepID=A0ABV0RYU3_9TELE
MKGPQLSKSATLLAAPLSTTVSTFMSSHMDILRIQDIIRDTVAGTSRLQTTSGGPDRGAHVPAPAQEAFRDEWWSVRMPMGAATVTVMKESNLPSPRAVTPGPALCGTMGSGER